jgi:hypothetical protein
LGIRFDHVAFKTIATGPLTGKLFSRHQPGALRSSPFRVMSRSAQHCAQEPPSLVIPHKKQFAAAGIGSHSGETKEN